MNENEKDASRPRIHHYELKNTQISEDTTEYVKTWICTECGRECEKRYPRIGAREVPRMIA